MFFNKFCFVNTSCTLKKVGSSVMVAGQTASFEKANSFVKTSISQEELKNQNLFMWRAYAF